MKKTKLSTYFVFISILTFLSLLVTIIHKSYSNLIGPIEKARNTSYERIVDTNLDLDILEEIEKRPVNFNESDSSIINYLTSSPAAQLESSSSGNNL